MSAQHFDLVSYWRIPAPIERVWDALVDVERWPQWWPDVRSVRLLTSARADGLGCRHRMEWRTRLPYGIAIDAETTALKVPEYLRGRTTGQLKGEGIWLLRFEAGITDVTYVYRVEPTGLWMRVLAPILAPLFRWNHQAVMSAGGAGLVRYLSGLPRG